MRTTRKRVDRRIKKSMLLPLIVIPYLITLVWIFSFIGLFIIADYFSKIFFGIISVVGFVFFIKGKENLKYLKFSPTGGIEIMTNKKVKRAK